MKWILLVCVFFGTCLSYAEDQKIEVKPDMFLALRFGYTNDENVLGVTQGTLPNTCFKIAEAVVERVSPTSFVLHQYAIESTDRNCAMGSQSPEHVVKYVSTVNFGRLEPGSYQVQMTTASGRIQTRIIKVEFAQVTRSTASHYAGISAVATKPILQPGEHLIVQYTGTLNNGCTFVDPELQVNRSEDTFLISPRLYKKIGICAQVLIPFQRRIDLGPQAPGFYLIHVRTMSGEPIQQIVQVQ